MCPNECPGLTEVYGDKLDILYTKYEKSGLGRKSSQRIALYLIKN